MKRNLIQSTLVALVALSLAACGGDYEPDAPEVPTGLTAAVADGAVVLGWNSNGESDLKGYHLSWGRSADDLTLSAMVPHPATTYSLPGLTNGTTYVFALEAENKKGKRSGRTYVIVRP
jgi:hypothetical protein